jgi:hypothetical protein
MAMQTIVSAATPHQTSARRCVTVRAMKSLMRMSKLPFNTNRRKDANAAAARCYFCGVAARRTPHNYLLGL